MIVNRLLLARVSCRFVLDSKANCHRAKDKFVMLRAASATVISLAEHGHFTSIEFMARHERLHEHYRLVQQ